MDALVLIVFILLFFLCVTVSVLYKQWRRANELEYWLGAADMENQKLKQQLERLEGGGGSKS